LPPSSGLKSKLNKKPAGSQHRKLARTIILGSGFCGSHDHIFLSHNSGNSAPLTSLSPSQSGKLVLVLASTVILCSKSHNTYDHILPFDITHPEP
jgi:hypothetical protein